MQLTNALMMVFAASAAASPIIGLSNLVLSKRESIPAGEQSCTCEAFITDGNWYIKIGAPFDDKNVTTFCNSIQGNSKDYFCKGSAIDNNFIGIQFQDSTGNGIGGRLNEALSKAWPAPIINGFNCPDH